MENKEIRIPMPNTKSPFSFKGRMGRKRFFFMFLIIFVSAFIVEIINSQIVSFIFYIILIPFQACNVVRRFHDLNKSGWHYWLGFIPIYNLYLAMVLFTRKGSVGANRYGLNQSNNNLNNLHENKNIKKITMYNNKIETFDLNPFDAEAMFLAIIFWIAVITGIGFLLGGFW